MNVSIVIATYGEQSWEDLAHERAMPSAAAQDAYEVLIGHDSEGTIAGVRNTLASYADGEWLCFLDADDELAPGYLGAMGRAHEREPATGRDGLLLTPAISQVRKGKRTNPSFYPEQPLEQGNWLCVGTLISRKLFERVGGFGEYEHGLEDWSLWLKASRNGARIVTVRDAVYVRHVNPNSKKSHLWRSPRKQVEAHERVLQDL